MLRNTSRFFPKLRNLWYRKYGNQGRVQTPMMESRSFYHRRQDPFAQMETFMRDIERKFCNEMNASKFPFFGRFAFPGQSSSAQPSISHFPLSFCGPSDFSTSDKFKLKFDLPQTKPDDIKVTLKDRLLTIEAKTEESSDTSKLSQSFNYQYSLPETVDIESLQSMFGYDGALTIEAAKTPDETPRTINIKRE